MRESINSNAEESQKLPAEHSDPLIKALIRGVKKMSTIEAIKQLQKIIDVCPAGSRKSLAAAEVIKQLGGQPMEDTRTYKTSEINSTAQGIIDAPLDGVKNPHVLQPNENSIIVDQKNQ